MPLQPPGRAQHAAASDCNKHAAASGGDCLPTMLTFDRGGFVHFAGLPVVPAGPLSLQR